MCVLVIAEKPSVAQNLSAVIGAKERKDGYLEGNGFRVSWCVGHLAGLSDAAGYEKWNREDLPIIPERWKMTVGKDKKKQFKVLKALMNAPDVTEVVNACDAGREGELIFRSVYELAGCKKPMKRLWISSMEDTAIRQGFEELRPGAEYDGLYEAALCRARADWLVGINATRFFSVLYHHTLNIGRVMSPTLALIVQREAEIAAFKPEPFYTAVLETSGITANSERLGDLEEAKKIQMDCRGKTITVVKVEQKRRSEKPPALYDLTSLQRDANRILGFTAQQTLDYLQSLYEKKLCTYPRTDSRYLTSDMAASLPVLVNLTARAMDFAKGITVDCDSARVINDKKVSDHHAVIPTQNLRTMELAGLPVGERAILELVALQLLCAVGSAYEYAETTVVLKCAGHSFTAKGRSVICPGWKALENSYRTSLKSAPEPEPSGEIKELPDLEEGQEFSEGLIQLKEGKTSPPKHFTEDTLLQMMESAGADEMPDEVERKGIGTPATRAGIIEKLVQKGFIERRGDKKSKHLVSTDKGDALVTVVPEQIQSPSLTADWEEKLLEIERDNYDSETFMAEISSMITGLIKNYEAVKGADTLIPSRKKSGKVIGSCPSCGNDIAEMQKGWFCTNKSCRFAIWKDNNYFKKLGKKMTPQLAEQLIRKGSAPLKNCRSERTGRTYNATVVVTPGQNGEAVFSLQFDKGGKA